MDIFRFINSRDIRKHLEDMEYEFNALEASWLVSQCADATLEEKNAAWIWIIEHMPDMPVHKRVSCPYRESLHDTLKKYMAMNEDLLERFSADDEAVYTYVYYEKGQRCGIPAGDMEVFFTLEECLAEVRDCLKEARDQYDHRTNTSAYITRHFKDREYKIEVTYDPFCRIKAVDLLNADSLNEEYADLVYHFFKGFWFDFPTPFKEGDIVHKFNEDPDDPKAYYSCRGVFVLYRLFPWTLGDRGFLNRKYFTEGPGGDTSDMVAIGYFLREDRSFYSEWTGNYMDLEYYRGSFTGVKRVCKALSGFMKGEMSIGHFTDAHRVFFLEKLREDLQKYS